MINLNRKCQQTISQKMLKILFVIFFNRFYFDRDVTGVKDFFQKKYDFVSNEPVPDFDKDVERTGFLDKLVF